MKKADKKVKEYLERAWKLFMRDYDYLTPKGKEKVYFDNVIVEIAKMIQREENK